MTTTLRQLLDSAAATALPPSDGFERALRRGRRLRIRALLARAGSVPLAVLVVVGALSVVGDEQASTVRTLRPADGAEATSTTVIVPDDAVVPPTPTTDVTAPDVSSVPTTLPFGLFRQPTGGPPPKFENAPPPGFRVAYTDQSGTWTMKTDGSDRQRLLSPARTPLGWSPDHTKLLLLGGYGKRTGLDVLDVTNGTFTPLVRDSTVDVRGADFSPDGTRLVYWVEEHEREMGSDYWESIHLFVSDADGRNARELAYRGRYPVWSPDGSRIAFECGGDSEQTGTLMCTMKPDGTDRRPLPYASSPASWSPDGKWLASNSGDKVLLVRADGSERRYVGREGRGTMRPAWTADSQRVLYVVPPKESTNGACLRPPCDVPPGIYSASIDGTSDYRITTTVWEWDPVTPIR